MTQIDYHEYIHSPDWYILTEPIRLRNGGRCECCNMRYGVAVHHRTYARLGQEIPEDLMHLCNACHSFIHRLEQIPFIWESRESFLLQLQKEIDICQGK